METLGDDGILPNTKSESEELEQGFPSTDSHTEDVLIEKLENAVLNDTHNDGQKDVGSLYGGGLMPLRPYAGDCPHFIRTGSCKFGLDCRYNHPDKRTQTQTQVANDLDKDVIPEDSGPIECKYYRTAEGCKYGKSCRYWHHGEESQNIVPELNFLGLPIRLGEKECPFYMRNGTCGYGSRCVFNHPDPTPMTGMGSPNSSVDEKFGRHHSSYVTPHTPPQQMQKQSEWNGCQAPNSHQSGNYRATPSADNPLRKSYISMQDEEFPERPGQPECDYFVKTGNCKFRSACRYHHPKDRKPRPDERVLSEKGLPLRPGRSICRHYERHGDCKFGSECLFDHPVGLSTYPDWHASKTYADSDAGSWGD
ncbi:unnamed protein product [Fraxinus pennsylvanica]|uniref:C3H1-type domain-containing protein n=1 Tax=Fraxinus pennsylvanica TaxID=56036 RepID=A0AAD2DIH4_9LAMI|nr:unnamed protein product [Fraxinus pennsylvanica]